jgi:GNAT superfamily N-acetyltransferase
VSSGLRVELVAAADVRPLRHEVLRIGLPESSTHYPGDDAARAAHFALRLLEDDSPGEIVSVGTVLPDSPPWEPDRADSWRIRGMATRERVRGRGLGRRVLDALIGHAADHGGTLIWCHARIGALEFYRRAGFEPIGDEFDDGVAIHRSMWRALASPVREPIAADPN